jgi:LuxR family maltose regulon positive regulatory protein
VATTAHVARAYAALEDGDLAGARAHLAETSAPSEPLWQVARAVVAAVLDRFSGAVDEAVARLDAATGAASLAGPWAAEWLREEMTDPRGPQERRGVPAAQREVAGHRCRHVPGAIGADGRVVEPLTPREADVLAAMSEWLTTEEIAARLFVSVNTVRTHVRNIFTKLGVSRRNAAIREAFRLGLLAPDSRVDVPPLPVDPG